MVPKLGAGHLGYQTPIEFVASWSHSQWEQSEEAITARMATDVSTNEESNYKSVDDCEA